MSNVKVGGVIHAHGHHGTARTACGLNYGDHRWVLECLRNMVEPSAYVDDDVDCMACLACKEDAVQK